MDQLKSSPILEAIGSGGLNITWFMEMRSQLLTPGELSKTSMSIKIFKLRREGGDKGIVADVKIGKPFAVLVTNG